MRTDWRSSGSERDSRDTRDGAGRRIGRCVLLHARLGGLRTALLPRASYGSKQSLFTSAASREAAAASEANLAHANVLSTIAAKLEMQVLGAHLISKAHKPDVRLLTAGLFSQTSPH